MRLLLLWTGFLLTFHVTQLVQATEINGFQYGLSELLIPASERCNILPEEPNLAAAVVACEEAANQGDPQAQFLLGELYLIGQVIPQDYDKAKLWFEKASTNGHAKAQYQLAFMYYRGEGMKQDYTQAYIMMKMAAVNGYTDAIDVSDEIGSLMDRDQRALAFYTLSKIFQDFAQQLKQTTPSHLELHSKPQNSGHSTHQEASP
ncbi:tetratricopeptide repeat protein [Zooshikella ganghwensis]|uniref:tetratricopeptide repeat protein n=1 Tax=Zooshikella ganghwensis TaxID=202772 RepID=UPI000407B31E|nr:tetratricopeptide repeat protein [Zooshikella ganghwensis]